MVKYCKDELPDGTTGQFKITDELAKEWKANGNVNISDEPWPDLKIVKAYIVTDKPS